MQVFAEELVSWESASELPDGEELPALELPDGAQTAAAAALVSAVFVLVPPDGQEPAFAARSAFEEPPDGQELAFAEQVFSAEPAVPAVGREDGRASFAAAHCEMPSDSISSSSFLRGREDAREESSLKA